MPHAEERPRVYTSEPTADGQFMLTVYRDSHGTTYTAAWRPDVGATWEPEHVLLPQPVTSLGGAA